MSIFSSESNRYPRGKIFSIGNSYSVAFMGDRSIKERPIAKIKRSWEENKQFLHRLPRDVKVVTGIYMVFTALTLSGSFYALNYADNLEKHPVVQVESSTFVPAHEELKDGEHLVHKGDAWYVAGKAQGQDPSQILNVEVSKEEFQSVKVGDTIQAVFTKDHFIQALEARRTTPVSQLPSKDSPALR